MKFLLFDTETTGLPQTNTMLPETMSMWPHIVQFSYLVYDTEIHKIIHLVDDIIRLPANIPISAESIALHGITPEISRKKGVDIQGVLRRFFQALATVDLLVGHNVAFDINMIRIELLRIIQDPHQVRHLEEFSNYQTMLITYKNIYCTMQESMDLCNILATNSRGTYVKYPKLVELYTQLFGSPPAGSLHNSLHDILATLRCFLKMRFQYDRVEEDWENIKEKWAMEKEEMEKMQDMDEILEMDEWLARRLNALHINSVPLCGITFHPK
jgi:DNA polymerase III epsilon subunit-like protein